MAEDPSWDGTNGDESPKKSNKTLWIAIGIIAVVVIVGVSVLMTRNREPAAPPLTLEGVNTQLQGAIGSLNTTSETLTGVQLTVAQHSETLANYRGRLDGLDAAVAGLTAPADYQPQIDALSATIEANRVTCANATATLNATVVSLNETVMSWNATVIEEDLVSLEATVGSLNSTVTSIGTQITGIEADILSLEANVTALEARVFPHVLVNSISGTTISLVTHNLSDEVVVATIYGSGLLGPAVSTETTLGYYGGNSTIVVGVAPLDIWEEGGIINITLAGGSIAFVYASVGG